MQLQRKLRPEEEDGDGRGGGQARCMSEGHPGGKLGMLCCCLSSSPLGSTALPQSHNYPLLQQAYALTASETPHLTPTVCLLHCPCPPLHCTQTLYLSPPALSFVLSLVAKVLERCCTCTATEN